MKILIFGIVVSFIGYIFYKCYQTDVRNAKKYEQCELVCNPYILKISGDDFCLCGNSSTVIWRKDIK